MTGLAIIRTVPLTKGEQAVVDQADYEMLSHWKWSLSCGYAVRATYVLGHYFKTYMHRQLFLPDPDEIVDHANGDGLDNRRANLRLCSKAENSANSRAGSCGASPYRGVISAGTKKPSWTARIGVAGRTIFLGNFDSMESAARAHDAAARRFFGEFARLNFPEEAVS